MELIGWVGSLCFAICGAPQAWLAYKQGHSRGISWGFLLLWISGEVMTLTYVIPKIDYPLIFNYVSNLIFLSVILYFKLFPGDRSE